MFNLKPGIKIVFEERPISEKDIEHAEKTIGHIFPKDYKNFLLQYNGGRPKPPGFEFLLKGKKEYGMVGDFYSIFEECPVDLLKKYKVFLDRIPQGFLSIGGDPGGNQILMGLVPEHFGKIYFWIHDLDNEVEDERSIFSLGFIANSFTDFLNSLDVVRG